MNSTNVNSLRKQTDRLPKLCAAIRYSVASLHKKKFFFTLEPEKKQKKHFRNRRTLQKSISVFFYFFYFFYFFNFLFFSFCQSLFGTVCLSMYILSVHYTNVPYYILSKYSRGFLAIACREETRCIYTIFSVSLGIEPSFSE